MKPVIDNLKFIEETYDLTSMRKAPAVDTAPLRALVFDFDGLLCDTEGAQVRAAAEVFSHHNATLPIDRWTELIGTATADDFWLPWLAEQASSLDPEWALEQFAARNHAHVGALSLNDGVVDLLDGASANNVPIAIASSSPTSWVHPLLDRFGIRSRFDAIVCREHAPRAKPAPDLYHEALRRLGVAREHAASVVALEDSRNGSLAAKAAGLTCIAIPGALTKSQDFSHVDHNVASMTRLRFSQGAALRISRAVHHTTY